MSELPDHQLPLDQSTSGRANRLLRRVWEAAKRNKGLVSAILALGVLEAALTKAPIALLNPLAGSLGWDVGSPTTKSSTLDSWYPAFRDFAAWLHGVFGYSLPDDPLQATQMSVIVAVAAVASLIGILGAFTIYGVMVLSRYFALKIVVDLRNEVGAHILCLPLRFFGLRRMGELMSNITNDTTVLSRSFTLACDNAVVDPLLIVGNVVLIALAVPQAVWVLLLMLPIMVLPMYRMGRKVRKSSGRSLEAMGDATESMSQMLSGIKTVKAFQLESQRLKEFEDNNTRYLRRSKRMFQAKGLSQALVYAVYQVAFAAMLLGVGWLVVQGDYTPGNLLVCVTCLTTTYTHVKRLTRGYNTLMESVSALDRVEALLKEKPDAGARNRGIVLDPVRGRVQVDNVSFSYGGETVLHDIDFTVEPGQSVALVGPSGAGKTTMVDLLARFHDPTRGRILIDGHDLREINLIAFRRHIAMVGQQPFVFNTSILENIRCGRPDATDEDVVEAARKAQIHDFIMTLPDGYGTLAGERGCNLSGGQMQRITIARAIVRNPAILFLDEATSALDSENESAVQKALDNLMVGRTSVVIAHRLSTTRSADVILVLENGRIVQRGRHEDLLTTPDGLYRRLSRLQQMV